MNKSDRKVGWDICRVILALMVFAFHANIHMDISFGIFTDFFSACAFCMTGFFVLSGTVLSYSHSNVSFSRDEILDYYNKRILFLIPLYWVVVVLYYFVNGVKYDNLLLLPLELLGIQAPFHGSMLIGHNSGTWFVSCLLFCYLLFPLMAEITKKTKKILRLLYLFLF